MILDSHNLLFSKSASWNLLENRKHLYNWVFRRYKTVVQIRFLCENRGLGAPIIIVKDRDTWKNASRPPQKLGEIRSLLFGVNECFFLIRLTLNVCVSKQNEVLSKKVMSEKIQMKRSLWLQNLSTKKSRMLRFFMIYENILKAILL